jgi:hypothetical protein
VCISGVFHELNEKWETKVHEVLDGVGVFLLWRKEKTDFAFRESMVAFNISTD